jgi:hypothetical protein
VVQPLDRRGSGFWVPSSVERESEIKKVSSCEIDRATGFVWPNFVS